MMLYPSLYHHHKVRTLECMLRAIFEVVIDNNLTINNRSFNEITDFLSVTDTDILSLEGKPEEVKPYIKNILNRQLLKRALVISKSTIKQPGGLSKEEAEDYVDMKYQKLLELIAKPERIKDLRYCIAQEVGNLTVYDVWIDLPEAPSFREASQTVIKITEDKRETLSRIFRVDKWITSYEENKWKGHVFAPPEHRKDVYKASKKIFKQELDIDFNEYAKIFAKCD